MGGGCTDYLICISYLQFKCVLMNPAIMGMMDLLRSFGNQARLHEIIHSVGNISRLVHLRAPSCWQNAQKKISSH